MRYNRVGAGDMVKEFYNFISFKIAQINYEEFPLEDLAFSFPVKLHSRYTRYQILVAMRLSTIENKSSSREGLAESKALNCEAHFVYDDYAINENLSHWQSQNQTAHTAEKGKSQIQQ